MQPLQSSQVSAMAKKKRLRQPPYKLSPLDREARRIWFNKILLGSGLKQKDFAGKLGMWHTRVSSLSTGYEEVSDKLIVKVCQRFRVQPPEGLSFTAPSAQPLSPSEDHSMVLLQLVRRVDELEAKYRDLEVRLSRRRKGR